MRWGTAIFLVLLGFLLAGPASAKLIGVNGSWTSNHTIGLLWDSYEVVYNWDELGPFKPFEDHVKEADALRTKFKSGDYKAIVLHVSMRNDSGHDMKLGYNVTNNDDGGLWLGGADGSAFCSMASIAGGYYTGWLLGDNHGGCVSAGSDLTSFIPDGMVKSGDAKPGVSVRGRVVIIVPKSFVPVNLYVHNGLNSYGRACLYGSEPLSIKIAATSASPTSADPTAGAVYPAVTGTWVSDGGVLVLGHEPTTSKTVPINGFWLKSGASPDKDSIGAYIQSGTLNPTTGDIKFTLASGGKTGDGSLKIAADGKSLKGSGQAGDVTLASDWHRQSVKDLLDGSDRAVLYGIYFEPGTATIKPSSQTTLLEIARVMRGSPMRLRIEAYGGEASQKQADAVKAYLVDKFRIDASDMEAVGCGNDRPLADAGNVLNTRIEIVKQK